MARCCGCASCGCKIQGGVGVTIDGTGSVGDPFVISADMNMEVVDNVTFDLHMSGEGTPLEPFQLEVTFAPTSSITHLGDVDTTGATAGQVLAWDGAQWEPAPPATATPGAIQHDESLAGDGSGATPLQVREDPARLLATAADGLGLSDMGINSTVRHFADATARNAANPVPVVNTLSVLDSKPGQVDHWTGTQWRPLTGSIAMNETATELLALSGSWNGTKQVQIIFRQVTTTTDSDGKFTVLSGADLTGWAGVMATNIQPMTPVGSTPTPFVSTVAAEGGTVVATAWNLGAGGKIASQVLSYSLTAYLY